MSAKKPAEPTRKDSAIKAAKITACFMGITIACFGIGYALGKAITNR